MRKISIVLAVGVLVVLAGCVTVTAEVTVDEDGMVEMDAEMELSEEAVQAIEQQLEQSPDSEYDSAGEAVVAELQSSEDDNPGWENVQFDYEEQSDGTLLVTIQTDTSDPADIPELEVEASDDEVSLTNTEGFEETDELQDVELEMTYIVHMPGEITDHNGEKTDDDTVEWTYADHQNQTLEVTSGIDEGSSGIPGFGIAVAIAALGLLSAAAAYRIRRR